MTGTCPSCDKRVSVMDMFDSLGRVRSHTNESNQVRLGGCGGAGMLADEFKDDPILAGLKALGVGDVWDLPHNGYVKKKGRNDFVLMDKKNQSRSRWGTASEIADDVLFFVDHGHLPAPVGGRW